MLVVLVAACGSARDAAEDAEVASLGGAGSDESEVTSTTVNAEDAHLEYARCMREQGIDMPDPEVSAEGGISVGFTADDIDFDALDAAAEVCRPLMEDAFGAMEPPSPQEVAEMRENALVFAECMRDRGLEWADPIFGDDGLMQMNSEAPVDFEQPGIEEALEACTEETGGMGMMSVTSVRPGS